MYKKSYKVKADLKQFRCMYCDDVSFGKLELMRHLDQCVTRRGGPGTSSISWEEQMAAADDEMFKKIESEFELEAKLGFEQAWEGSLTTVTFSGAEAITVYIALLDITEFEETAMEFRLIAKAAIDKIRASMNPQLLAKLDKEVGFRPPA